MPTTASAAGATFVPMLSSTLANSPCAKNPNTAMIGVSLTPGARHPNAFGSGLMTTQAVNAVQAALTAPTIAPGSTNFDLLAGAPNYSVQVESAGIAPQITSRNPPAATLGIE